MFGRPHWFRKRQVGWGLVPLCWQAWVYGVTWYGVILLGGWLPWRAGQRGLGLVLLGVFTLLKLLDMKMIRDRKQ